MVVNAGNREKIVGWLAQNKGTRNVEVRDRTMDTVMAAVQGPKAMEIVRGLTETDASKLAYYHATPTHYRGADGIVSRTGYTGEDGIEIIVPASLGVALFDDLTARGARPCGLGARDTLRLEAAMPLYDHELTEEINPLQAGLGWAVKLNKGDFIGRDALLRLQQENRSRPVARRPGASGQAHRARGGGGAVRQGRGPGRRPRQQRHVRPDLAEGDCDGLRPAGHRRPLPGRPGWLIECGSRKTRGSCRCRSTAGPKRDGQDSVPPCPTAGLETRPDTRRTAEWTRRRLRPVPRRIEWASLDGGVCTVGLTQFVVEQLTDVIYIELPDVGGADHGRRISVSGRNRIWSSFGQRPHIRRWTAR